MKTTDLFKRKTVLSYEVFPPKASASPDSVYTTISHLSKLHPDFISVTYGAGGGDKDSTTFKIASSIKHEYGIEGIAHLACYGMTKEKTLEALREMEVYGIENVMALRGDEPVGRPVEKGDFNYAYELIEFIKENSKMNVLAACYPEGHTQCPSIVDDIHHLKQKVDAGASHLVSQLFFDNTFYYNFLERCAIANIDVPIEAGIMPVVNKKQIERMVSFCGASLPKKFLVMMQRYEHDPIAMRDAGIAYAVDQIVDLVTQGVSGIHLYTMNNPFIASRIYEAVHSLVAASVPQHQLPQVG